MQTQIRSCALPVDMASHTLPTYPIAFRVFDASIKDLLRELLQAPVSQVSWVIRAWRILPFPTATMNQHFSTTNGSLQFLHRQPIVLRNGYRGRGEWCNPERALDQSVWISHPRWWACLATLRVLYVQCSQTVTGSQNSTYPSNLTPITLSLQPRTIPYIQHLLNM